MTTDDNIWFQVYGKLLGVDPTPANIAAAIERMMEMTAAKDVYHKSECERLIRQTRDSVIKQMRSTAVNCGASGSCAVSYWFKLDGEK